jgi:ferredoxin--NADP+ reductase
MPPELAYNATLVDRIDISASLAIFRVEPDDPPTLGPDARWFDPGQYVVLGLNNEERPELGGVRRPMTIVSPPQEAEVLDFYVKYVEEPTSENPLTHRLWKTTPGDRLFCRTTPTGKFTIEASVGVDDPRLRVLVAAGTGLAPFICMLEERLRSTAEADLSQWVVLHGVSHASDLAYRDRLHHMKSHHGLHYLPTVSRSAGSPGWAGHTGRVEDFFTQGRFGELETGIGLNPGGLNPNAAVILVCGLRGTIREMILRTLGRRFIPHHRRLRRTLGVPDDTPSSLFFEQFDTDPVLDLKESQVVDEIRALFGAD